MKLLVVSYKVCWYSHEMDCFVTYGGFPFQMKMISELFDQTRIILLQRKSPTPQGSIPIEGNNIQLVPLSEPFGKDFRRKLRLLFWLPKYLHIIWREVQQADAVHTPIPGDIGSIGLIVALLLKKPLFVRHCGRWDKPNTTADRLIKMLLERIAGQKNVVLATGGADHPPSKVNPNIHWIFSTSLTGAEYESLDTAEAWTPGQPLRLITVGTLSAGKNIASIIQALPGMVHEYADITLDVIGEGYLFEALKKQAVSLGVEQNVRFLGYNAHTEVLKKLAQSHLFIFPTLSEGFPKALFEAMACGLPVVANSVSVIPDLVGGGCGILLKEPTPKNIKNAVLQLLKEPEAMVQMGKKARAVVADFTLERWRDQIGSELSAAWGCLLKNG